jgi:5-formyltetrahydrofolate cyclo-ligase
MNSRLPLLFYPLADEVDIRPLLEERSKAGLAFCLPRYEPTLGTIVIHKITNLESQLAPGAWKIMEPLTTCPQLAATEPDLILVPGVAFDAQGYRLGRGKGLYDRLLAQTTDKTLGICLGVQHVAMLPREDFDIPVQQVLSEEA